MMDTFVRKLKNTRDFSKIQLTVRFQDGVTYEGRLLMTGSLADQFDAAVRVIHGLPKDAKGPFQPSNELKLKFYALYKQAKVGPCNTAKPGFWDIVSRAKWESWNALGQMSADEAMNEYVDNIKQIIETMPLDEKVGEFMNVMSPLYEFVELDKKKALSSSSEGKPLNGFRSNGHLPNGDHVAINGAEETESVPVHETTQPVPHELANTTKAAVPKPDDDSPGDSANISDLSNGSSGRRPTVTKSDLENGSEAEEEAYADASDMPLSVSVGVGQEITVKNGKSQTRKRSRYRPKRDVTGAVQLQNSPDLPLPSDVHNGEDHALLTQLYEDSWNAAERLQVEKQIRQHQRAQWSGVTLAKPVSRKARGHSHDGSGANEQPHGQAGRSRHRSNATEHNARAQRNGVSQELVLVGSDGSERTVSGGSHPTSESTSASSSSVEHSDMTWDPHVAAVLFKMHRQLRQMNRQLELIENSLIAQHQLIRHVIQQQSSRRNDGWSWLPAGSNWRAVAVLFLWPIVVHFFFKFSYRRYLRSFIRRRLNF